ncbi:ABC transporter permease subunit [Streptomyces sp. NPDC087270]|uniref:ABC transporter permease subunit n=1 Tax=Streptomyces sp. NPDC087270 TaxID=3365774 RepID=UPI00380BF0C7
MNGFPLTVRAEWTKLRTVRGWVLALVAALVVVVGIGYASADATRSGGCPGMKVCGPPKGPGGVAVVDDFTFVQRPLGTDGTLTARITSMTGRIAARTPDGTGTPDLEAWAKAGLIVKAGTAPGSTYAAVMVTGGHGVRMQSDFTHDTAGPEVAAPSAAAPRWLRLTRAGSTLTGGTSPDGTHWTTVGTATLPDLPATARVGLFVTSSAHMEVDRHALGSSAMSAPTRATAAFDRVTLSGGGTGGSSGSGGTGGSGTGGGSTAQAAHGWQTTEVGGDPLSASLSAATHRTTANGEVFSVSGSGDIAPAVGGQVFGARSIERGLAGTFAGLLVVVVVGSSFVTAEYRRGLIRTTLAAQPRRGQVLAAKAVVVGAAAFAVGLAASVLTLVLTLHRLRSNGVFILPASFGTETRVVVGTALLVALAAVLALAVGTILRRATGAVTAVVAGVVLPYILAMTALPDAAADWVLRVTPAAAFAIQQTTLRYHQVANVYAPSDGYYPLPPWAGLAVLCGWTAVVLAVAYALLRRRDT